MWRSNVTHNYLLHVSCKLLFLLSPFSNYFSFLCVLQFLRSTVSIIKPQLNCESHLRHFSCLFETSVSVEVVKVSSENMAAQVISLWYLSISKEIIGILKVFISFRDLHDFHTFNLFSFPSFNVVVNIYFALDEKTRSILISFPFVTDGAIETFSRSCLPILSISLILLDLIRWAWSFLEEPSIIQARSARAC